VKGTHPGFSHGFAATDQDTRAALATIMARLRQIGVTDEQAGGVEIALAEVVNNILEHAYSGVEPGRILLRAISAQGLLQLLLVDWGAPLPDEELPEGGFGWFLIRTLARDVRYRRANGRNHLRLTFDLIPAIT
jgi:serine/threonine-protein kinase RsbW